MLNKYVNWFLDSSFEQLFFVPTKLDSTMSRCHIYHSSLFAVFFEIEDASGLPFCQNEMQFEPQPRHFFAQRCLAR